MDRRNEASDLVHIILLFFSLSLRLEISSPDIILKGGIHISAHVHESKCFFFLFLINFMALKIPLTCTSVITFYN